MKAIPDHSNRRHIVPLATYANQDVTLLLKVACGGENPWNCDIGYFDEISVIVE